MLKKIYLELVAIRKELQAIRSLESLRGKSSTPGMSKEEIQYRAMTEQQRQAIRWVLSLEKDSETLKTIKKLSFSKNSDNST